MTNVDADPVELVCRTGADHLGRPAIQVLEPRDVPLGGIRAMTVRRTLPLKQRSLIGAWCFADHYGPDRVAGSGGMDVAPHPHTGLQTVSWLFAGEIEHRDSLGSHAMVRPGELNLMTAGRGISHSEVSTPDTDVLHGVQLWLALPEAARSTEPAFEHVVPEDARDGDVRCRVFIGTWLGLSSPATVHTPLLGAELVLQPGGAVELPLEGEFEHGVLVDSGSVTVNDAPVGRAAMAYLPPGTATLRLTCGASPGRVVVLGGTPLNEEIVMWWNFIGRTHDEVVEFRSEWQAEIAAFADDAPAATRFGRVLGYPGSPLPAPTMPAIRLKPRPRPGR
jgi:redox-sensitive bicupin YhaK (pirin superfamily)